MLRRDGTLWLNLGDSYRNKQLLGIPWRVALSMQRDGWVLRQDIIWYKPNVMPESVRDRCTRAHEYIFLFTRSKRYWFDYRAIREPASSDGRNSTIAKLSPKYRTPIVPGQKVHRWAMKEHERWKTDEHGNRVRNKRSVWIVPTKPFPEAHFAVFPPNLIEPCIKAGCPQGGVVLDPFFGSGTTGLVAKQHNRQYIGIELSEEYCRLAMKRICNG